MEHTHLFINNSHYTCDHQCFFFDALIVNKKINYFEQQNKLLYMVILKTLEYLFCQSYCVSPFTKWPMDSYVLNNSEWFVLFHVYYFQNTVLESCLNIGIRHKLGMIPINNLRFSFFYICIKNSPLWVSKFKSQSEFFKVFRVFMT